RVHAEREPRRSHLAQRIGCTPYTRDDESHDEASHALHCSSQRMITETFVIVPATTGIDAPVIKLPPVVEIVVLPTATLGKNTCFPVSPAAQVLVMTACVASCAAASASGCGVPLTCTTTWPLLGSNATPICWKNELWRSVVHVCAL